MTAIRLALATAFLAAIPLLGLNAASAADPADPIRLAQAAPGGPQPSEEEKKRKELERQKAAPHTGQPQAHPQPPAGPHATIEKHTVPPKQAPAAGAPVHTAPVNGAPVNAAPVNAAPGNAETKRKQFERAQPGNATTNQGLEKKTLDRAKPVQQPAGAIVSPGPVPQQPLRAAPVAIPNLEQIQKGRQERVEDGGRRTIIQEPGNRIIAKQGNQLIIQHDDAERFRSQANAQTKLRPDRVTETVNARPNGDRIVTEMDANGRLLRRYRRGADGREHSIIDNRSFLTGLAVGAGIIGLAVALELRPVAVDIPRKRYIVDYRDASDDDLYEALSAPPLERLDRPYSLYEVRYSSDLRDRMRRIDLDDINFDFGASNLSPEQYPKLERLARLIRRMLDRNPDEVFLIEGHTDAVGSEIDNLSLSDRRASAVADVLTATFGIPPENLVTQGYGKQFLKIDTPEPERANRRVALRRITPLMSAR